MEQWTAWISNLIQILRNGLRAALQAATGNGDNKSQITRSVQNCHT
jgi:hypothetical protein